MNRQTALFLIHQHESELKGLGVVSLSLFGSLARDEATPTSDVDVAVQLEDIGSGFAMLARLDQIRDRLTAILGLPVDVIAEPTQINRIKAAIDRDRALAF